MGGVLLQEVSDWFSSSFGEYGTSALLTSAFERGSQAHHSDQYMAQLR